MDGAALTLTFHEPLDGSAPGAFTLGGETAVATVVATDDDARDYITDYEITGGTDGARFSITNGGALTFAATPDFERPTDVADTDPSSAANDNHYIVAVTATSGKDGRAQTATQTITVTVTDLQEPPGRPPAPTLAAWFADSNYALGVRSGRAQPTNTGPDITDYDIRYRAQGSGDFDDWPHAGPRLAAAITGLHRNRTYEVQVSAVNDEGMSAWSPSAEVAILNEAPSVVESYAFGDVIGTVGGAVEIVDVYGGFDDSDDRDLRFAATSSDGSVATVRVVGSAVMIGPVAVGTATIAVTATDPYGATAALNFDATIQAATLQTPTVSINGDIATLEFTDVFEASKTRTYGVRIRQQAPPGLWTTACVTVTNAKDSRQDIVASGSIPTANFFEPGIAYEVDYGYLGATCEGSVIGRSQLVEVTTSGTSSFDIEVVFIGPEPVSAHKSALRAAGARWQRIITHSVQDRDFSANAIPADLCLEGQSEVADVVDDLRLYARFVSIDGSGGTLGQAGPCVVRPVSFLPAVSFLELDTADLNRFTSQALEDVVVHEMGHALGFGTVWENHNLLRNPSLGPDGLAVSPRPDTHFAGPKAIAAFDAAGGSSYTGAKVPVENDLGGTNGHWRESVLRAELMTGLVTLGDGEAQPLSATTIQSLADLGYRVDVTQADAFTLAADFSGAPDRVVRASASAPLNCIVTRPIAAVDEPGPVVLAPVTFRAQAFNER